MSSLFKDNSGSYVRCRFPVDSSKGADKYRTVTRCFSLLLPPHPSLMCLADRCDRLHGCPFNRFQICCSIFWHAAPSLRHRLTPVSSNAEFLWGELVSPIKPNHATNFFMGSSFQCRTCTSTCLLNSEWLTHSCAICCTLSTLRVLHPADKQGTWHKSYVSGSLFYWIRLTVATFRNIVMPSISGSRSPNVKSHCGRLKPR